MAAVELDTELALWPAQAWRQAAACRGRGPLPWYARSDGEWAHERDARVAEARRICQGCPVRGPCLEEGMAPQVDKWGVWGGLDHRERRRLAERRAAGGGGRAG